MSIASATIIGGLSSNFARNAADFYPTPRECTEALIEAWRPSGVILEPACGDGAIARVLHELGYTVHAADLHDRGYGLPGQDFLAMPVAPFGAIITNPPFNLAEQFIRKARSFGVPFAMLLKSTYWNAASRERLFRETGPEVVYALTWRPNFAPERGSAPTMDVCWTVWGAEAAKECRFALLAKPKTESVFA